MQYHFWGQEVFNAVEVNQDKAYENKSQAKYIKSSVPKRTNSTFGQNWVIDTNE